MAADLLTLYQSALANNASYAAARADLQATQELIPQAQAQYRPNISFDVDVRSNQIDNQTELLGANVDKTYNFTSQSYEINLTQPVYRKQIGVRHDQAKKRVEEAEAKLAAVLEELTVNLGQAYFEALLAKDNIALIQEQKNAILAQLKQARSLYDAGQGTVTDINEAQARLDSIQAQEIGAINEQEVRYHSLQELTGTLPNELLPINSQTAVGPPEPAQLDTWIEAALEHNANLAAAAAALDAARLEAETQRSGRLPTVDLVARISHAEDPGYTTLNTSNQAAELGLRMNWPFYQGGYVNSRIRQAVALEEKTRSELEALRRKVIQTTRQEYLNVVSGSAQVQALEQAYRSHEVALYSMEQGFKAGVRTSVDILNEQQLLYTSKRDLLKARYGYLMSLIRLKSVAGQLNENEIARINHWFGQMK